MQKYSNKDILNWMMKANVIKKEKELNLLYIYTHCEQIDSETANYKRGGLSHMW